MRVWRKNGERFDIKCMVPTFKSGYELVNVWGAFSYHGRAPLRQIAGRFTDEQYKEICETVLWPCVRLVYGDIKAIILQEDNRGPHRAIAIRNYMAELRVTRMNWPAQSPDLNPIENAWGHMKNYFHKQPRYPKNKEECYGNVQKLWSELPLNYFQNLVGSMAHRIKEVNDKSGGPFKY